MPPPHYLCLIDFHFDFYHDVAAMMRRVAAFCRRFSFIFLHVRRAFTSIALCRVRAT